MSRSRSPPRPTGCGSGWTNPTGHFPARRSRISTLGPSFRPQLETKAELALRELELESIQPRDLRGGQLHSRPSLAFHGNIQAAIAEARNLVEQGYRVVFFAQSTGELERLADIFQEYSVPFQLGLDPADATRPYLAERSYVAGAAASTLLVKGLVRRGVVFPDARIAVFGSEDLFDSSDLIAKPGPTKSQLAAFTADMADLKPGDYVVHVTHGIGRFLGTREIAQGENKGDFMLLEYAGDAKLYVPLTRLDLIQKYRGAGEGAAPALDRLGGATWERTKSRVKAKMRDMADELLKLYAQRRMAEGFAFSPDSNWQREFEDAFEFTETKDQLGGHQADQERHGERASHGPPAVRRRGLRQNRSGHARGVQSAGRRQTGGGARAHHRARLSALRNLQAPLRAVSRCASKCSAAFATRRRSRQCWPDWPKAKWTS